jgi:uncharacterized protein YjbI with pentapeptide repeats
MWGVDMSQSVFSGCNASDSSWRNTTFKNSVFERCNWFQNRFYDCSFEKSMWQSIGFNEARFTRLVVKDLMASSLRLRSSEFKSCEITDSTISDSAFEYCGFFSVFTKNFKIIRPTYSPETKFPDEVVLVNAKFHSTNNPQNN